MHFLLMYDTAPDYLQRRAEFRSAHLALAWQAAERGELLLGGAVGEPADSALLLFHCDSADIPAAFAKADPYVLNGLVKNWQVKPWHTVVGEGAANPVKANLCLPFERRSSPKCQFTIGLLWTDL